MWVAFANAKATHIFFSKNISIYAIYNVQSFNDTLTNDIISFEQLGPGIYTCEKAESKLLFHERHQANEEPLWL